LLIKLEDNVVRRFHFLATEARCITIGRSTNNDITFENAGIAMRQASIDVTPTAEGGVTITIWNHDAQNGILVNNESVTYNISLSENDVVRVGRYTLTLYLQDKEAEHAAYLRGMQSVYFRTFPLDRSPIYLGAKNVDIEVQGWCIANKQAAITIQPDGWFVTNVGVWCRLYVNGERINRKQLVNGDVIQVGSSKMQFVHK